MVTQFEFKPAEHINNTVRPKSSVPTERLFAGHEPFGRRTIAGFRRWLRLNCTLIPDLVFYLFERHKALEASAVRFAVARTMKTRPYQNHHWTGDRAIGKALSQIYDPFH
ncbi:hypothetical protein EBB79_23455 (plasmid) [Parasedimentitalea marina]|uniref:Uncharacterized protein n=2 Tax=Parasedimentitalea marina TaxID=2483033 RepID=A0A3T0NAA0_9RHOB|nr:hypothetical protein EBB79_23455 [Parasedimentitalea marina]